MQFSEQWLRTMVDPGLTTAELTHLLTMSGLEVEACEPVAPPFEGVVVAEVRGVTQHPNADKLKVCEVDAGGARTLRIVCGAPNVVVGMKAPLAIVGARLPGETDARPLEIRAATMRGVESQGMLCSARELKLSEDHSGLLVLDASAPVGASLRDYLALDDHAITIKLTPNRPDCLSVLGVAREVSALSGAPLHAPRIPPVPAVIDATFPVRISDPRGCGRFTGRVIRGVNAAASTPDWMKQRLARAGQRSISALVDVTNYVMLELGRPLHVYDLAKLDDHIDVRFGRRGEMLKLLNEQTVELDEDVLAITDASGAIGLAGIMGGDSTKADLDTQDVLLEAAFFFPDVIAGRARRYNFSSDASHRFERGVDFENNIDGIERATALLLEICGGQPGPLSDTVAGLPVRKPVRMRVMRAQKILGVPVPADEMADVFSRLRLPHSRHGTGEEESFVVTPPSYRFDIEIEEDLIEEVARVHGFENIPANPPLAPAVMLSGEEALRPLHALRVGLAAAEYLEVVNFSFVDASWEQDFAGNADPIRLLNPIAQQFAVMRSSLIGGLVANVKYNLNRKASRVRVFEVGRVFLRRRGAPDEPLEVAHIRQPTRVGALAFGPALEEQWGSRPTRSVDFFDVKADLEALAHPLQLRFESAPHPALHPGRSARVMLRGAAIGWIGELHPRWLQQYELPSPAQVFEVDADPLCAVGLSQYRELSKFQPVLRDLSFEVDEAVPVQAFLDELQATPAPALERVGLFDLYRGEGLETGKKSLAFRVLLQDTQKTLTDSDVESVLSEMRSRVERRFGARLRK
jgi:phenylalanyl-tRNA synthetase beta chain